MFVTCIEVVPSWEHVQKHSNEEGVWCWSPGMPEAREANSTMGCPPHWQEGTMIFLYKGGGKCPKKWKSYRPISLLPTFYKLWSIVQNERLRAVLEDTGSRWQFGYRERCGTSEALQSFDFIVRQCRDKNLCASLLDMSEAFDRVIRKRVIERLVQLGCPENWV